MAVSLDLYAKALTCASSDAVGKFVYLVSGTTVALADGDSSGTMQAIGVIVAKPSTTKCFISCAGDIPLFSGLTPGSIYYISGTAGAITTTAPAQVQPVGIAKDATTLTLFTDSLLDKDDYEGAVSQTETMFGSFTVNGNGSSAGMTVDANNNVVIGSAALATTATNGFLYIESCAGLPTGVAVTKTGRVALVYDSTNDKLCVYDGGWLKTAALT